METNTDNELEEVAYLDVTIYEDSTAKIEMMDNGKLSDYISDGMIKDDSILSLMMEVFIKYQYKTSEQFLNSRKTN